MNNHVTGIERELRDLSERTSAARDVYFALLQERNDLIDRMIGLGIPNTRIAEIAGVTREQIVKMARKR